MSEFLDDLNIKELNKYQKNKRNWLMESEDRYDEITIKQYWNLLENNNINVIERARKKDLYDFTHSEIIEAINYAPTTKIGVKTSLFSAITKYEEWACNRGFNHVGNPCDIISMKDIKINMTAFKLSYMKLDEFYGFLETLQCSDIDKIMLVLARYGVKIKDMPNLRWEDVDRDCKTLTISYKYNNPILLPVDDRFIEYVDKAKAENGYTKESKSSTTNNVKYKNTPRVYSTEYVDLGYILKITDRMKDEGIMKDNSIRNRINEITKIQTLDGKYIKRPKVADYNDSRRYDLLFDILQRDGKVTRDAVKYVLSIFEEKVTISKVTTLKTNFELLADIKIDQ